MSMSPLVQSTMLTIEGLESYQGGVSVSFQFTFHRGSGCFETNRQYGRGINDPKPVSSEVVRSVCHWGPGNMANGTEDREEDLQEGLLPFETKEWRKAKTNLQ